jgi:hypothetical protein
MKLLQVAEQAFRTLVEEQDDTILWLSQSVRNAGADMQLLLAGNCAYYAVLTRRQPKLTIGSWQQKEPAEIRKDLDRLQTQGVAIYVADIDLADRGLADMPLHPSVKAVSADEIASLYEEADLIWQW